MPFKKGKSGNPGGRPKDTLGAATLCREWANKKGFKIVMELAEKSTNAKIKLAAAQYLIDRGHGKATEYHKVESATLEEILERANKITDNGQKRT